jgi:hypothetical protein
MRRFSFSIALVVLGGFAWAASPARAVTEGFEYTGGEQTFEVPSGVHFLHLRLIGGSGGEGSSGGGAAAAVTGVLEVTPGQLLYVEVGGTGEDSGAGSEGGFNGGANGGGGAGGGGGASDIRLQPRAAGLAIDTRGAVAAGGGGGAGDGENAGGAGGAAGSGGGTSEGGNEGGGAGTESTGGGGGFGCSAGGTSGERGSGGAGGPGFSTNSGGGGGGGLFGGGGGGGGCGAGGGGGGGGSSLVPLGGELEVASISAVPVVEISYTPPPTISIVSPAGGATFTLGQAATAAYSCTPQESASLVECAGPVANGALLDTAGLGQHTFTVEAEDSEGGTSSKSVKYTVLAPAPSPPSSNPTPTPIPPAPSAPDTLLGSHPAKKLFTTKKKVKVKFTFSSSPTGATFQCKLDKAAFSSCASPKSYKVKPGKHKFTVAAVKDGLTDPTAASFKFTVVKTS